MQEQWNSSRRTLCISQCQNSNSQCQIQIRNANTLFICLNLCEISQCQFQFRNAKISQCEISQCQNRFRSANLKFAMPILISQCENFAIPNSQCENFAMRNFAMPKSISHCEIHCLCEIEICRPCHPL